MNRDVSSTLRLFTAIILGIMFIAAGISGRPGSIIGSLIDAEDMIKDTNHVGGGGSVGSF